MSQEKTKQVFVDTLEYIRQLVEIRKQPAAKLSDYGNVTVTEGETSGLPAIDFCPTGDEEFPVWLSLKRLHPSAPPELSDQLKAWVIVTKDVDTEPSLREWVMQSVTLMQAQSMLGRGLAKDEHVNISPRDPSVYDVRLFSEDDNKLKSEFVSYVGKWKKWAKTEKPRRQSIALYQRLFGVHQKMNAGEAERPLELVWGIGHAVWKVPDSDVRISHPLIEILVELSMEKSTQTLSVRPRSVLQDKPTMNLDIYESIQVPLVKKVKESFIEHLERLDSDESSISPDDSSSFIPVLKTAVSLLSDDARFWPDENVIPSDRSIPKAGDTLNITDTWVVFARNKSQNSLTQDIERLQKKAAERDDTDGAVAFRFAEEPSSERPNTVFYGDENYHGGFTPSREESRPSERIIYFPKPFNDAQREIIGRLEQNDGVVVQGPPGTGKTHTIANIICHYLASGKRVLVTAKSETALNVLKEQIPSEIQPLVISLVSNDQEGLRQQKDAIQTLQAKVVTLQGRESQIHGEIQSEEVRVAALHQELDRIKALVTRVAEQQLSEIRVPYEGMGFKNAKDLACWIVEHRNSYNWLQDELGIDSQFEPIFSDDDIRRLITAKEVIGDDLVLNGVNLPALDLLPNPDHLKQVHEDLCLAAELEVSLKECSFPRIENISAREFAELEAIIIAADKSLAWSECDHSIWELEVYQAEINPDYSKPAWLEITLEVLSDVSDLVDGKRKFFRNPVRVCSTDKECLGILRQAAERKLNGKSLYSIKDRFNKRVKEVLSSIEIVGIEDQSLEYWQHLNDYVTFSHQCYEARERWNILASEASFEPIQSGGELRIFEDIFNRSQSALEAASSTVECINRCRDVFGGRLRSTLLHSTTEGIKNLKDIASKNLAVTRLVGARETRHELLNELKLTRLEEGTRALGLLKDNLGNSKADESFIEQWSEFYDRVVYLDSIQASFNDFNKGCSLIARSGAPLWSATLEKELLCDEQRSQLATWRDAWRWRRLSGLFASCSGRDELEKLESERQRLEAEEGRLFESIVRNKTFLALCTSMSARAKAGLVKFTAAVSNIGKGTGKKAPFYIRAAQKAMNQCADAVPCWIMPSWRVSEVLPSEFDYFDLVIIDEASQCDVREIPAVSRGRKILVVGDDKQVSPTPDFVDFDKFLQMKHNYLSEQPFSDLMLPGSSLYDLACAVFTGGSIILNEHFRCVEPIIRFSFQFYRDSTGTDLIIPLRVAKASERIDPPLVDIFVKDGYRHGDTNPREAEEIVAEVKKLVEDPQYEERSIGVISLIGRKQAELVQRLLLEEIGQETYMRHKIVCGDSATFQGRERDIIFLSMVAAKGQRIAKATTRMYEQRFNVAASRARDRMYLVHSVAQADLASDDLKSRLLQHFSDPMPSRIEDDQELIALCQSPFEESVFTKLRDAGYLVRPQVPSMGRSIDLVVEGAGDARLAIELDGDSYHGPEVWLEDWMRQKSLERIGWKFWRCWYSSYVEDPDACMASLFRRLEEDKIFPQDESAKIYRYTDFRVAGEVQIEGADCHDEFDSDADTIVETGDTVVLGGGGASSNYISARLVIGDGNARNYEYGPSHPVALEFVGKSIGDEVDIPVNGVVERKCIISLQKSGQDEDSGRELIESGSNVIPCYMTALERDDSVSVLDEGDTLVLDRNAKVIPSEVAVPRARKTESQQYYEVDDFALENPISSNSNTESKNLDDLTAIDLQEALVEVLLDCPNHSCTLASAPKRVLKYLGIRTRGAPFGRFTSRLRQNIRALENKGKIESYKATNQRIRLA